MFPPQTGTKVVLGGNTIAVQQEDRPEHTEATHGLLTPQLTFNWPGRKTHWQGKPPLCSNVGDAKTQILDGKKRRQQKVIFNQFSDAEGKFRTLENI